MQLQGIRWTRTLHRFSRFLYGVVGFYARRYIKKASEKRFIANGKRYELLQDILSMWSCCAKISQVIRDTHTLMTAGLIGDAPR